ncbi:ABC transporter substrate-binding protein [Pleomorphochaeta sp. DL1XJH-081]|uniref:ABC transporter substrate-binding protein n=1 Tax=Pleomorphochaeta sp. DL1XJH-081 TaxID=3409690 RepID=UPI003BB5FBE8
MEHKKIRVGFIVLIVLLPALLFAGGANEMANDTMPEKITEVEFWHYSSGLLGEAMTELVDNFNATIGKEKGIVVTEVFQGKASDVATKVRSSVQANRAQDLPDLAQMDATGVMDIRDSVLLVPAQKLVDTDSSFSLDDLQPGTVLSMTYKDVMIGMPFNASTILLYYNKDAFREVGLDPERPPRTLSELAEYAGKLMKMDSDGRTVARYGFAGVPSSYELVSWIGQQQGVSYLTDKRNGHDGNPTKVVFDSDGTMATFLEAWKKVYESGGLANMTSDVRQQFIAGKTAMFVISTSSLATVLDSVGDRFEVGVGYLPQVNEASNGGVNIGGGAIFAFENGNDPQKVATWEFLKYLMSPQSQLFWHQRTGYFPVHMDTYGMEEFKRHLETNPLFKVAIDQVDESDPRIQSVWWPNSYQAYYEIQNTIIEMLERDLSIDSTVQRLADVLNGYMDEYNRLYAR